MLLKSLGLLLGLVLVLAATGTEASAQTTCATTVGAVTFSGIDLTQNSPIFNGTTLTVNCTGTAGQTGRTCVSLGAGSAGSTGNLSMRYLLNGSNQLGFNIYTATSNGQGIFGSSLVTGTTPLAIDFTLDGTGKFTAGAGLTVQIFAGQQTLPNGLYSTAFSSSDSQTTTGAQGAPCSALIGQNSTPINFTISANYPKTCALQTHPLDFGQLDLTKDNAQSSSIDLTCTFNASYTVALNGGLSSSSDPARRLLKKGAESIVYGLYTDAGHTVAWGDGLAAGGSTLAGLGSGYAQSIPVYGLIARQTSPSVGTYTDTVVVTVTY